jgi:D-alanine-D-alanine ligase
LDSFVALGARDYGRIDIRMDSHGVPHFLEANLISSLLRDYGNFPKACLLNSNIDYENMIYRIIDLSLSRRHNYIDNDNETVNIPFLAPLIVS